MNDPLVMLAAEGYRATCAVEVVVLETSTRRWMTAPGFRWSTTTRGPAGRRGR